jgi:dienelactone hydrolase
VATSHQHRRWIAACGVAAVLVLATACASTSPDSTDAAPATTTVVPTTTSTTIPDGGYEVVTHTENLVDTSRPTEALEGTGVAAGDERTLATTFTFPDAPGPFPLIAFAHGNAGHPRKFTQLFEAWAAAGFVVVAPAFPLSNDEIPGITSVYDLPNQPGDMTFAISSALRMSGEPENFLQGKVNPEEIGVGGLSLGGATTFMVAFDDCCRDRRVDAVIVMDGFHPDFSGMDLTVGIPLLIIHADGDPVLDYSQATEAFAAAATPKYLVTLHEVVHATPYENDPDPADQLVTDTTTAFWRLHLAHDAGAATDLSTSARVDGLSTVVEQPG